MFSNRGEIPLENPEGINSHVGKMKMVSEKTVQYQQVISSTILGASSQNLAFSHFPIPPVGGMGMGMLGWEWETRAA